MCTLVILRRPDHPWPLLVAGNRDEMADRAWSAPARHWPERPDVVAGLDQVSGGSWFGVNDYGVVAVVTNREGTLGPAPGKRSRGELVLEALDHAEASEAASALTELNPQAYRGFNLFVGDPRTAHWLCHRGGADGCIESHDVPPGLHMLTARDLDDITVPRIRSYLPRFTAASVPDPERHQWQEWQRLLACRTDANAGQDPLAAPNFTLDSGFGTVCSQMVAVPRYPTQTHKPVFLFAAGAPDRAAFDPIAI